jgi:hypothetical protein
MNLKINFKEFRMFQRGRHFPYVFFCVPGGQLTHPSNVHF